MPACSVTMQLAPASQNSMSKVRVYLFQAHAKETQYLRPLASMLCLYTLQHSSLFPLWGLRGACAPVQAKPPCNTFPDTDIIILTERMHIHMYLGESYLTEAAHSTLVGSCYVLLAV